MIAKEHIIGVDTKTEGVTCKECMRPEEWDIKKQR